MSDNDAILDELKSKVEKLVQLYNSSLKENISLKNENQILQDKLQTLQNENDRLTEDLKFSKIANAINGNTEESRQAQKRLDHLVREIDKCLSLLNQ